MIIVVILASGGVILFSGGGSFTTANISDVALSKDVTETLEPVNETETFSPEDDFHLTGKMNNVPPDTVVRASWYYLEEFDNQDPPIFIHTDNVVIGKDTRLHFPAKRVDSKWVTGEYEVRVFIEGKGIVENVQFSVQ